MTLKAYARIHCDLAGCKALIELPTPLRLGQLNPVQVTELNAVAEQLGWHARWIEPTNEKESAWIAHYCPIHWPEDPTNP